MNPSLQQAVKERVDLNYDKAKIVSELKASGYDDTTIEQVYQSVTQQVANTIPIPPTSASDVTQSKKTISPWLVGFAPSIFFVALIVLWGVANLIAQGSSSETLVFFNSILVPFLIGLTFISIPVFVIIAIVMAVRKRDGVIRCGNCNYNGMGESGRSVWAQILVWIAFLVFWPITLIYYLVTHRYRCPQCKSTFVGMRDKHGKYSAPSGGVSVVAIVAVMVIVIAIVGILAAVVIASLNDARDAAKRAAEQQLRLQVELQEELRQDNFDVPAIPVLE
jgi:multisubunit Na+/H+ antiporter MnhB subunit